MSTHKNRPWTKEEIDFALTCLAQGMSSGVTAKTMNEAGWRSDCPPMSRCAIIGVWNRYAPKEKKFSAKSQKKIKLPQIKKKQIYGQSSPNKKPFIQGNKPVPPSNLLAKFEERYKIDNREGQTLGFFDIKDGMCKFIFGGPGFEEINFCGESVDYNKGRSYCSHHYSICYQAPIRR